MQSSWCHGRTVLCGHTSSALAAAPVGAALNSEDVVGCGCGCAQLWPAPSAECHMNMEQGGQAGTRRAPGRLAKPAQMISRTQPPPPSSKKLCCRQICLNPSESDRPGPECFKLQQRWSEVALLWFNLKEGGLSQCWGDIYWDFTVLSGSSL